MNYRSLISQPQTFTHSAARIVRSGDHFDKGLVGLWMEGLRITSPMEKLRLQVVNYLTVGLRSLFQGKKYYQFQRVSKFCEVTKLRWLEHDCHFINDHEVVERNVPNRRVLQIPLEWRCRPLWLTRTELLGKAECFHYRPRSLCPQLQHFRRMSEAPWWHHPVERWRTRGSPPAPLTSQSSSACRWRNQPSHGRPCARSSMPRTTLDRHCNITISKIG